MALYFKKSSYRSGIFVNKLYRRFILKYFSGGLMWGLLKKIFLSEVNYLWVKELLLAFHFFIFLYFPNFPVIQNYF